MSSKISPDAYMSVGGTKVGREVIQSEVSCLRRRCRGEGRNGSRMAEGLGHCGAALAGSGVDCATVADFASRDET